MRRHLIASRGGRVWQGIPGIERAPNGRLWCVFFSGGAEEPSPENTILLTTSADDGRTWSPPEPAVLPAGGSRVYDPCLWHDPQGILWLFYNRAAFGGGGWVEAMTTAENGLERPAWRAPRRLELGVPFAYRLNKPTVITGGAWLLPVTYNLSAPAGWFGEEEHLQGAAISRDGGLTWQLRGAVQAPAEALENMILERRDGSLWMLIRTGAGVLWQSTSRDGGHSWAAPAPTEIVNPGVRFFIRRLRSGRVLLINTPDPRERRTLLAYLSDGSDGAPFGPGLMLDPRAGVSYPDAVQAPGGLIYAVHDYDRQGAGEIVLDVFSEDDILAAGRGD